MALIVRSGTGRSRCGGAPDHMSGPVKVFGCRPMTTAPRTPGPASANLQRRCYGAGVDEDIASVDVDVNRWSTPHAEVERPEPIPHASQTGSHADRRDRDEPFELARCGDCAWHR